MNKNIHTTQTDKPSRLLFDLEEGRLLPLQDELVFMEHQNLVENRNIYITNDEEIKEGDWYFLESVTTKNMVLKANESKISTNCKKIILTTDPDLIKDGVQAIDDEFLEWFVKNPSCEYIKTDLVPVNEFGSEITVNSYGFDKFKYKIIIPQEEPKQINCEHCGADGVYITADSERVECIMCEKGKTTQEKSKGLNLKELESKLNTALENETEESLANWLNSIRRLETLKEAEGDIDREEWINFFKNNTKEEILEYLINYKFPL